MEGTFLLDVESPSWHHGRVKKRRRFADLGRAWADAGELAAGTAPDAIAELLTSVTLGFVAQLALVGDADPGRHEQALAALMRARNG